MVVYKEHIEVIFNVSFSLLKNNEGVEVVSRIKSYDLYERYSRNFYINFEKNVNRINVMI